MALTDRDLRPFRQYSEHDVVNLYSLEARATESLPVNKGTIVSLVAGKGWEASDELVQEAQRIGDLRDFLYEGIAERLTDVTVNGDLNHRLPGNLNLSFADLDSETIISALPDIAISSGSACTSNSIEPSYVIRALGLSEEIARNSFRFGIGRFTTKAEIDYVIERLTDEVVSLRAHGTTQRKVAR